MVDGRAASVLHVSEAFGGGVVAAVHAHVGATPEFEHVLAFSDRPETPLSGHDLDPFDAIASLPATPVAAIRTIRRILQRRRVDVIHAHSVIGGALARIAAVSPDVPVVYSPHCFAHLRADRSRVQRDLYRMVETRLARFTAVYAACSPYELEQAAALAPRVTRVYVPNAVAASDEPQPIGRNGTVHILGDGRLCAQKDPAFFAQAVRAIRASGMEVDAAWIGDGEAKLRRRLEAADIEVTGWLPREESLKRLAQPGGIYLHTARWEGFPYAILEAQAAGLPMIVRHIPTLADFDFPVQVCEPIEVARAVKELQADDARARAVTLAAASMRDNNRGLLRERLLQAYGAAMRDG